MFLFLWSFTDHVRASRRAGRWGTDRCRVGEPCSMRGIASSAPLEVGQFLLQGFSAPLKKGALLQGKNSISLNWGSARLTRSASAADPSARACSLACSLWVRNARLRFSVSTSSCCAKHWASWRSLWSASCCSSSADFRSRAGMWCSRKCPARSMLSGCRWPW